MNLSVNNSHLSFLIAQIGGGTLLGLFFLFLLETPVMGAQTRTIDIAIGTYVLVFGLMMLTDMPWLAGALVAILIAPWIQAKKKIVQDLDYLLDLQA